jgi:hypothetical protein
MLASRTLVLELQMTEITDYGMTTDDDDLPLSITHSRDTISFAGKVEQDYRFLVYRFKVEGEVVEARMYLDEDHIHYYARFRRDDPARRTRLSQTPL